MNMSDKKLKSLLESQRVTLDEAANRRIDEFLETLPQSPVQKNRFISVKRTAAWLAVAAACVFIILPNVSPSIAHAMTEIPVIGGIVKVITIRGYSYNDSGHTADIKIPEILEESSIGGASEINRDTKELTDRLIAEFKENAMEGGYGFLAVDYEVVTDTSDWFTLKLTIFEVAGSSDTYYKYYHIDRATGENVQLSDLFADDAYVEAISEDIRKQMIAQMEKDASAEYLLYSPQNDEWNFYVIDADQNFYFNEEGKLVIVYDKYEVAPGAMGCPEFVVEEEVYADYLVKK